MHLRNSTTTSPLMNLNAIFTVLWLAVQIANAFGFTAYAPSTEMLAIAPAVIAIINLLLRYLHVA